MRPEKLSKVIHERVRLAIVSSLAARGKLTFGELKELLEVTDGNLSVHASILEKNGLIRAVKEFAGRKPRTTFSLTAEGRREFKRYVAEIEQILRPQ
ncbi:MAG: transcriptional regulator [Deltaproteobacteria bacterium]|nr:transcriptional regulator [Deltaproteobacteria bacterium]